MSSSLFVNLFLTIFLLALFWDLLLDLLNLKNIKKNPLVPDFYKDSITQEKYIESQQYTKTNLIFGQANSFFSSGLTLAILFSGFLPWLNDTVTKWQAGPLTTGVLFLGILTAISSIANIPFDLFKTFKIEAKFGFNKSSLGLYIADFFKGFLLNIIIGVPFLYVVLWFLETTGDYWWLWTFSFTVCFQLIMMIAYPILIAPLFNKYEPLQDGELKEALLVLSKKADFPNQGIFVMDGSKRSSHSNAYFSGFGKLRRIVLFDTLVEQLSIEELKSVLAHEIGHYKKGHIYKMLGSSIVTMGIFFWLLSLLLNWEGLYTAFQFETPIKYVGLFLCLICLTTFTSFFSPLFNIFSRKHEYEADEFSVLLNKNKKTMISSLIKLSEKNLSNLTPHPLYSFVHYSHPTTIERAISIEKTRLEEGS